MEPPCWRQVVHRAIEHGINYLDTAPLYGIGECERLTGLALSGGFREKVLPLRGWAFAARGNSDQNFLSHVHTISCGSPVHVEQFTTRPPRRETVLYCSEYLRMAYTHGRRVAGREVCTSHLR